MRRKRKIIITQAEDTKAPMDMIQLNDGGYKNIITGKEYDVLQSTALVSDVGQYHFQTVEYVMRERAKHQSQANHA